MVDSHKDASWPLYARLDQADLDPEDWSAFRATAHAALDGIRDYIAGIRDRPVWQPVPASVRNELRAPLPRNGEGIAQVCADFDRLVLPYATGNVHPRFWAGCMAAATPPA